MTSDDIQQIKKKIEEHEKRIAKLEGKFKSRSEIAEKPMSVKEFIISKKPKGDIHKTLAIGYYLEKYRGMKTFNLTNLKQGFKEAKERVPKNISDTVYQNVKKGRIAEVKESKDKLKDLYLTNTGERFVENGFKK